MRERFERVAGAAARRPVLALGIVLVLALGGGVLALRLKPSTGINTFVSGSSYQATVDDQRHFGSDAVVILIREPLMKLVLSKDLGTLSFLEACLAGQVVVPNQQLGAYTTAPAASSTPYGGRRSPCGRLMAAKPVQAVYGPGTFINEAVKQIGDEFASETRSTAQQEKQASDAAYKLARAQHRSVAQARKAAAEAAQLVDLQFKRNVVQIALRAYIMRWYLPGQ